jgi:hypothetical protein
MLDTYLSLPYQIRLTNIEHTVSPGPLRPVPLAENALF